MLDDDEQPDGKIRIYYVDNTYKSLPVKLETTVNEIVEWLCKRLAAAGRPVDPKQHELFMITPGVKTLREQQLLREDRLLQMQCKVDSSACKILFREIQCAETEEFADTAQEISEEDRDGSFGGLPCLEHKEHVEAPEASVEEPDQSSLATAPASARTAQIEASVERSNGRLKSGQLERLLPDGQSWQCCTVCLDEDRFWYFDFPSESESAQQSVASVQLSDCERVLEGDDQRVLQLVTRCGCPLALRARSGQERNSWLLAVVKQAAVVKEGDILMQAEQSIANVEFRRSSQHLATVEAFQQVQGVIRDRRARALFLDFLHDEHHRSGAASYGDGADQSGTEAVPEDALRLEDWPDGGVEGLASTLEALSKGTADAAQIAFIDDVLFPRFRDQPLVQDRLCGIAAGIG